MLIQNVEELHEYLGRIINLSLEETSMAPFIQLAQDTYIKKAIGAVYLARLEAGTGLTAKELELLKLVKRALAFYTYEKYSPFSLGNDGDGGLHERENSDTKPVRIGVLEKRQRATSINAGEAMEAVLFMLFEEKASFDTFWSSVFGVKLQKRWFRNAEELNEVFPQVNSNYRLLLTLNPYFDTVENSTMTDVIGSDILDLVRAYHITTTANPDPIMAKLYTYIKRYIAYEGYSESLLFSQVFQTEKGLRVYSEFDGINNSKPPEPHQFSDYKRKIDSLCDSAKNTLIGFLNKNTDTFPSFKNSPLFRDDGKRLPKNKDYKAIFRMK
jgi:hypothetical protein